MRQTTREIGREALLPLFFFSFIFILSRNFVKCAVIKKIFSTKQKIDSRLKKSQDVSMFFVLLLHSYLNKIGAIISG